MKCICIYDSRSIQAEEFATLLREVYQWYVYDSSSFEVPDKPENFIFVVLGGDGMLLYIIHLLSKSCNFPTIYPINYGTIGFLTNNRTQAVNLENKIQTAVSTKLYFLEVELFLTNGEHHKHYALNDASVLRQTGQAAHMKISINNIVRIDELVADGIIVATPAGSTAYNFSVGGPIFDLRSRLLCIQPVSAFRPRYWRGALLNDTSLITIEILQTYKRPVSVNIDSMHFCDVEKVVISSSKECGVELLFDKNFTMEDKILSEQFSI
ncbi:MAG: NAD+ kinase [Candidatus Deianiraeaceae bacterium]|jgi:NAD+ kinase